MLKKNSAVSSITDYLEFVNLCRIDKNLFSHCLSQRSDSFLEKKREEWKLVNKSTAEFFFNTKILFVDLDLEFLFLELKEEFKINFLIKNYNLLHQKTLKRVFGKELNIIIKFPENNSDEKLNYYYFLAKDLKTIEKIISNWVKNEKIS